MEIENRKGINILKGIVIAVIATLIMLFIYSVILTYTELSEDTMFPVLVVITGISLLLGSFLANVKLRKNGLINGGMIGFLYMIILYILSSIIIQDFSLNFNSIIIIISATLAGMLGGIIAVNISK